MTRATGPLLIALVIALVHRQGALAVLFGAAVVLAYRSNFPGALKHYDHRYLYVLVIPLALGAVRLLGHRNRAARWAGAFVLAVATVFQLRALPGTLRDHITERERTRTQLGSLAQWMNAHIPPNARVMLHDVGYVSWATSFPLIDMVGLKNTIAMRLHAKYTWPTCGNARPLAAVRLAEWEKAEYLVMLSAWDTLFEITASMRRAGFTVEPLRNDPLYEVYRVAPPVPMHR
jgi:hypothetical protein